MENSLANLRKVGGYVYKVVVFFIHSCSEGPNVLYIQ